MSEAPVGAFNIRDFVAIDYIHALVLVYSEINWSLAFLPTLITKQDLPPIFLYNFASDHCMSFLLLL